MGFGSTGGPPKLPVLYNNLTQIVQTETHVLLMAEMNHDARIIRLNAELPANSQYPWMGDSVGYFEGDSLIVETTISIRSKVCVLPWSIGSTDHSK